LGLGFGLTAAFIGAAGIFFGFFARQTAFTIIHWIKQHILKRPVTNAKAKAKSRHPTYRSPSHVSIRNLATPPQPNVIHLSMNPAIIHQQTTMDILQQARQQRLEAIQAQQAAAQQEPASPSARHLIQQRMNTFKVAYGPMRSSGALV
jgi:hypothetical protein